MARRILILTAILAAFLFYACEKEVSVSPPDEPPPDGKLLINTVPDSFRIFLEGKDRLRLTPDSIRWLESGTYQITLKKNLFLDSSFTIDVTEGERTSITIDYTIDPKFRGSLSIESNPANAEIYLNGENTYYLTPKTITGLLPGLYKVTLKKENYSDYIFYKEVRSSNLARSEGTMIDTTKWESFNTANSGIVTDQLTSITIDSDDNLWMGSREGVIRYKSGIWENLLPGNADLPHKIISDVEVDEKNRLWVVTYNGMAVLNNGETKIRFTSTGSMTAFATGFGTDSIYSAIVGRGSPYFYATDLGLGLCDEPIDMQFEFEFSPISGVSHNLTAMEKIDKRTVLVGTAGSGLVLFKNEKDYVIFTRSNSNIPGNYVSAMYSSSEGIWIGYLPGAGTGGGLTLYDGDKFTVYNLAVPPPKINTIFVNSSGTKFVGTNIGLYVFNDFADKILYDESSSGLPIKNVNGITEDSNGNIWFSTSDKGLFKLKRIFDN